MPLNNPLTIIVRVSQDDALGDAMKRLRVWLDSQKIQAASFTTADDDMGYMLKIGFINPEDADSFRDQFQPG